MKKDTKGSIILLLMFMSEKVPDDTLLSTFDNEAFPIPQLDLVLPL